MSPSRLDDWGSVGKDYKDKATFVVGSRTVDEMVERLSAYTELGDTLDVGCGPGYFSGLLAHRATRLVCTDISPEMVRLASAHLGDIPNASVERADCCHLHYKEATFDTVSMCNLLHVVDDPLCALKEARRVLRPDGRLIVFDVTMYGMNALQRMAAGARYLRAFGLPPGGGRSALSPSLLRDWVESVGLRVIENETFGNPMRCIHLCATMAGRDA